MTNFIIDESKTRSKLYFDDNNYTNKHYNAEGQLLSAMVTDGKTYSVDKIYPKFHSVLVREYGDVDGPEFGRQVFDPEFLQELQKHGDIALYQPPEKFNLNMADIRHQSHDKKGLAKLEMLTPDYTVNKKIAKELNLLRMGDNIKSMLGINVREPEQLAKDQAAKLQRSFDLK